ncbi:MAG TPA: Hsp20 family protein [Rectinemataceae bacterium]|nr:Hsp20 family protein [Rectinemataceae bacterium]
MKTITLYKPLAPMWNRSAFRNEPFEFFDRFFDFEPVMGNFARNPAVDAREDEKAYTIEVELPGLAEKDIKLEIKEGVLSLSTAKKDEKEESPIGNWIRRERREFSFARSFELPEDADAEQTRAKLKDGLLTIELPKKPAAQPKVIEVKVA